MVALKGKVISPPEEGGNNFPYLKSPTLIEKEVLIIKTFFMMNLLPELNDYLANLRWSFKVVVDERKKYFEEKNVMMMEKSRIVGELLLNEIEKVEKDMGLI